MIGLPLVDPRTGVVEKAHAGGCFVTNALNAEVLVEPTIESAGSEQAAD